MTFPISRFQYNARPIHVCRSFHIGRSGYHGCHDRTGNNGSIEHFSGLDDLSVFDCCFHNAINIGFEHSCDLNDRFFVFCQ